MKHERHENIKINDRFSNYFVVGSLCCVANNNAARSTLAYVAPSPEMQQWFADSMKPQNRHRYAMSAVAVLQSDVIGSQGPWKVPLQQRLNLPIPASVEQVAEIPSGRMLFGTALSATSNQPRPLNSKQRRAVRRNLAFQSAV